MIIDNILAYPLSALFAMAASIKVVKYATYRSYLHESGLMSDGAALWVSFMLPAVELIVAGLLAWPRSRRIGLWAVIALLPFYHYYLYYVLHKAPFIPCGCLGVLPITWEQHYTLNILVLLISIVALIRNYSAQRHRQTLDKGGSPAEAAQKINFLQKAGWPAIPKSRQKNKNQKL